MDGRLQHDELVAADPRDRVPGAKHPRHPPRQRHQEMVANGMAEAVVDELEAVDVDEQNRAAAARLAPGAHYGLVYAVHEQRPVGEPGERVVKCVVLEPDLGAAAIGDVRERARHPCHLGVAAADREAAAEHPAPGSIGVAHPVLGFQMRCMPGDVRVDRRPQAQHIVAVHEVKPGGWILVARALGLAQDRAPAWREVDPIAPQIPVPDAVVRGPHGERVSLLALDQVVERPLMADRISDRALQSGGLEVLLDEVVGDPEGSRLQIDLVVAGPGEDDHRRPRARRESLPHQLEAGVPAEAVIDHVDVVPLLADRLERLGELGAPVKREARAILGGEHVAGDQVVVLVVLDQQDAQRLSR